MSIRLIDVRTLRLKSFHSIKTPPYAILSHTWVEDEEVSFEEMRQIAEDPSHPARRRHGYLKIQETCRQAMSHGLEYAWVDTCCIDKGSSAELSEAINSMFRWYRDAAVCFAYLADYTLLHDSNHFENMRNCKWFTRGWCLQELIAPKNLIFYDTAWTKSGSKSELKEAIASITHIDHEVLEDHNVMYSLPVARRMSWASNRATTRVEDLAYCLLGIFDIHMSMLYGEGDKAFVRLQEEIIQRFNDTSIFLFSPKAPAVHSTFPPEAAQICEQRSASLNRDEKMANVSNDDESQSSTTTYLQNLMSSQFCGMLATSPADFSACGNVERQSRLGAPFEEPAFSVTNRGIQLGRQKLRISRERNCFIWKTSFFHRESRDMLLNGAVCLRKIGRNLYARVLVLPPILPDPWADMPCEDVCVLPRMTASTLRQIYDILKSVLRVKVKDDERNQEWLSNPNPKDSWDESGNLFLVSSHPQRRRYFHASVQVTTFSAKKGTFMELVKKGFAQEFNLYFSMGHEITLGADVMVQVCDVLATGFGCSFKEGPLSSFEKGTPGLVWFHGHDSSIGMNVKIDVDRKPAPDTWVYTCSMHISRSLS